MEFNFCVICSIGGMILGFIITSIFWLLRTKSGTLRIDHSNHEKDVYRFEIDRIEDIGKKKQILLKIDNNADLSHE